jgi:uncharacterized protein YukE
MQAIFKEMEKISKAIEDAKKTVSNLEGREAESLKALKAEFQISSLEEGEEKIAENKTTLLELEAEIKTSFQKLQESYQW